jgi:hypothetical protein
MDDLNKMHVHAGWFFVPIPLSGYFDTPAWNWQHSTGKLQYRYLNAFYGEILKISFFSWSRSMQRDDNRMSSMSTRLFLGYRWKLQKRLKDRKLT